LQKPEFLRPTWGLLATTGMGLLAIGLTVARGLPYGHDSALHLYRLVERDCVIRQGFLFSRWSPFLSYGYGSPLFNYYPSLLYYLAEPFMLAGLGPLAALRATMGLALVGGALGVYLWVRGLFGVGAGVVAAAASTFSPYVMYTLVNRASFPEILAMAWMGWGLWAMRRHAAGHGLTYGAAAAVVVAAALFSHLFSAYLFVVTLLLYALALNLTMAEAGHRMTGMLHLGWPIILGLGLAAFFWLPAMWEKNLVQVEQMLRIADPATGQGLGSPLTVFAGPTLPDATIPVAVVPPRLSPLAASLALIGVLSSVSALRSRMLRTHVLIGVVVVAAAVFMHIPISCWLWQALPMLRLAQFPFRLLSAASLWLALLAGAGGGALLAALPATWPRLVGSGLAIGLSLVLTLYALGWPAIAIHSPDLPAGLADALQFERQTETMGLQTGDEYRIQTVRERPLPESGPGLDEPRLDAASLPEGARVMDARYDWLEYTVTVESPQPFQAVFRTFHFAGWKATVNGQPTPIRPVGPYGLIGLDVPAGRQRIEVRFGSTPVRDVAAGLTLASATGLLGLLAWTMWRSRHKEREQ